MSELLTGTLEHRHHPQYQPNRIKAETREGRYWERSTCRKRTSKGSRNGKTRCGKLNCPSDSKVIKGDRLKEEGPQCCPTLQRADSREVISWSGRPIEFQNEREGNRLLFDPMVGHIRVPQLGKNEKMVKCWIRCGWRAVVKWSAMMLRPRTKPRGPDEKEARAPLRQPWRAKHGVITLDLSTAGRSGGRG